MILKNQVAIITGASSGIGEAVAITLNKAGMSLILTARREERLKKLSSELSETVYIAEDITEPSLPQRLIDMAVETFGRCDVVFNNAGILETGPIETIDIEKVCLMVRINVEAAFRMAYTAMKHFKKQNYGFLINTSSIIGTKTLPRSGAYGGTKFALEALTESLRMELAKTNIRVTCIEPALVDTELNENRKINPIKALGIKEPLTGEDIAGCVLWILEQPDHVRIPKLLVIPGEQEI